MVIECNVYVYINIIDVHMYDVLYIAIVFIVSIVGFIVGIVMFIVLLLVRQWASDYPVRGRDSVPFLCGEVVIVGVWPRVRRWWAAHFVVQWKMAVLCGALAAFLYIGNAIGWLEGFCCSESFWGVILVLMGARAGFYLSCAAARRK